MRDLRYKDPNKSDPKVIGQRIREAREARGMTQAQLAGVVGTSQQTVEKIELGKVQRSSYIYPIYDALGLTGAPIANYDPAPRDGEVDTRGEVFRIRREYLGLTASELAVMGQLTEEEILAAEAQTPGPGRSEEQWRLIIGLNNLLTRLENGQPIGEPLAPYDYHLSALPTRKATVPYFAMGSEKGIAFQGYIAAPMSIPRMFRDMFCIRTAPWVQGLASGGDRIYCRLQPDPGRHDEVRLSLAVRDVGSPLEVSDVIVGEITREGRDTYKIHNTQEAPILQASDWTCYEILDAAWSNATFKKIRSRSTP